MCHGVCHSFVLYLLHVLCLFQNLTHIVNGLHSLGQIMGVGQTVFLLFLSFRHDVFLPLHQLWKEYTAEELQRTRFFLSNCPGCWSKLVVCNGLLFACKSELSLCLEEFKGAIIYRRLYTPSSFMGGYSTPSPKHMFAHGLW